MKYQVLTEELSLQTNFKVVHNGLSVTRDVLKSLDIQSTKWRHYGADARRRMKKESTWLEQKEYLIVGTSHWLGRDHGSRTLFREARANVAQVQSGHRDAGRRDQE